MGGITARNLRAGRDIKIQLVQYVKGHWTLIVILLVIVVILVAATLGLQLDARPKIPDRMAGDFNVAVADFSAVNGLGQPIESEDGTKLAESLHKQLEDLVAELELKDDIDYELWSPAQTGPVRGNSPEERETALAVLADRIKADVVISGVLMESGDSTEFSPEFYLNETCFDEAAEITGRHELGGTLTVFPPY